MRVEKALSRMSERERVRDVLCLIKVSLINFWDVPHSSAGTAVVVALAVQLGNHFSASEKQTR